MVCEIKTFHACFIATKMVKKSGGRNGFFIFMMELKSKQGYNFKNNEEVSKAADPLWRVSLH